MQQGNNAAYLRGKGRLIHISYGNSQAHLLIGFAAIGFAAIGFAGYWRSHKTGESVRLMAVL
jgi:hypothetical protein